MLLLLHIWHKHSTAQVTAHSITHPTATVHDCISYSIHFHIYYATDVVMYMATHAIHSFPVNLTQCCGDPYTWKVSSVWRAGTPLVVMASIAIGWLHTAPGKATSSC